MAAPRSTPVYELTGPQRAAVILLALGAEYGRPVWSVLDDDEIRLVTHAMVQLGSIEAEAVEALIVDFVGSLSAAGSVTGTFDRTAQLLAQILPPKQPCKPRSPRWRTRCNRFRRCRPAPRKSRASAIASPTIPPAGTLSP